MEEKADSTEYSADDAIYVPYSTVSRMMNIRDVDSFTITFKDEEMAAEAKQRLKMLLRNISTDLQTHFMFRVCPKFWI